MKNEKDRHVIQKMIGYCDDVAVLMEKYHSDFHAYDYENVDLDIVWNTLREDIPDLKIQLQKML